MLIGAILIFLLVASAMAFENKSASSNFTGDASQNANPIESTANNSSVSTGLNVAPYIFSKTIPNSGPTVN